jgi:sulfotransferase family protein
VIVSGTDLVEWSGLPAPSRPVFVSGCSRSGTTLLGAMLGLGGGQLTVPESEFKWLLFGWGASSNGIVDLDRARPLLEHDRMFRRWGASIPHDAPTHVSHSSFVRYLVGDYARREGKDDATVWIDHSPGNVRYMRTLLDLFPNARFVHLIRDGRAVAASILPLDWGPNTALEAAHFWSLQIAAGLAGEEALGPDVVHRVRYEDLLSSPAPVLQKICDFAGLSYDDAMVTTRDYEVRGYETAHQGRVAHAPDPNRGQAWRNLLPARDIEDFEWLTCDLLSYLGYEPVFGPSARRPTKARHARVAAAGAVRRVVVNRVLHRRRMRDLAKRGEN